jgi:hypothetical protein
MTNINPDLLGWINREVDRVADLWDERLDRAFPAWALTYLYDLEEEVAFNRSSTLVVGDGGVDGWFYNDQDQVIVLLQAKWSDSPETKRYSANDLSDLIRAYATVVNGSTATSQSNNRLGELQADMRTAIENGAGVVLAYVTAGRITSEARIALEESAQGIGRCTVEFYDLETLADIRASQQVISDLAGRQVSFIAQDGTTISSITIPLHSGAVNAATITLDGRGFGDAIFSLQPAIYHSNVRYSLGPANKVNAGIRNTIKTPAQQSSFWLFNNGLTIICDALTLDSEANTLVATNPQIVNGAQTSASLASLRSHLNSGDLSVQARIIEIDPDRPDAADLARDISKYTNSQSPVKLSDLRSNEPRHEKLQVMFDSLERPVFYERRRGEWGALEPAQKARFGNPPQRVTKEDIGSRFRAYKGEPAQSISKKDEIFATAVIEASIFDPQRSAELYMLSYELFDSALALMSKRNAPKLYALMPGWHTNGAEVQVLVDLRTAPKYVAAYATALASEVLVWRYSNVATERAKQLRLLLTPGSSESQTLWRLVLKTMHGWAFSQQALNLRTELAKDSTFNGVKTFLYNELAGLEKDEVLPVLRNT